MGRFGIVVSGACLLSACGIGTVIDTGDAGGCPYTCPEGTVCVDRQCVEPDPSCEGVTCFPGERCVDGECVVEDACAGVECDPGYTCQHGACVYGQVDNDGDGSVAEVDCDDDDPTINPRAMEECDGVDQDCDGDIDEGYDSDLDGYTTCGGGDPSLADCDDDDENVYPGAEERCNDADDDCDGDVDEDIAPRPCATACGNGDETCVGGRWECDALETCDCIPPDEDTRPCTRCGTETRTCRSDNTWSDWGPCQNQGACDPGDTRTEECGNCGSRTQTCGDDCEWGGWSGCTGELECSPGEVDTSGCDPCIQRTCDDYCRWSPCGDLRPGAECYWNEGHTWRCCGAGAWEWCLSSCQWSGNCAACSGCC